MDIELSKKAQDIEAQAKQASFIMSLAQYEAAGALLRGVAALRKEITASYKSIKDAQNAALAATRAEENKALEPVMRAEAVLKKSMADYDEVERRRMAAEQAAAEEQARAAAEAGEPVAEVVVAPAAPAKVQGVSFRENWSAVVVDLPALVKAVAEGTAPATLLVPNQTALNEMARALKGSVPIPGVVQKCEKTTVVR